MFGEIVAERHGIGVVLSAVHFGGGNAVADHLEHKAERHFQTDPAALFVDIHPVLVMVTVASFVVQPGAGIAEFLPWK